MYYSITILLIAVLCHTASGNLLINPTFDQANHGWSSIGHGFSTKKDTTTGNIGLYLTPAKAQTVGARQVVNVGSSSPSIVTVSAKSLIEHASDMPSIQVVIVDVDGKKTASSAQFDRSSQWSTANVRQIVSSVASVEVNLLASNEAAVLFDDIIVTVEDYGFPGQQQATNYGRTLRSVEAFESVAASMGAATTQSSSSTPQATTITTPTYTLGLKYLILSYSADDIRLGVVTQTFDSVGSQYDIIYPANLNNASLNLTTPTGGKYIGVVFCTDVVGATDYQIAEVEAYLVTYSVKKVIFYTYPYTIYGVQPTTARVAAAANGTISFAPASSNFISGYNTSAQFQITGIWSYPAEIVNSTLATPALYIQFPNDDNTYVIASFITSTTGSHSLQFFVDQATWSTHSVGFGSFLLQWISNNMYLGLRRIFLNCHADDLFLYSNTWDTELEISSETIIYRINGSELLNFALYINETRAALPAGTNWTVSFPFNGQGVGGVNGNGGAYDKDDLYMMAKTPAVQWTYVFQQHTWDHPELTNLTYEQTYMEIEQNLATAIDLFGSLHHPRYSNNSMVTPSISGLFNGAALKALWDQGIYHIVGDNSQPGLLPPFQYHGWYTNVTVNGFAGMHIVPREATYIYYDCGTDEQSEGEYNNIYLTYYGSYSTLADIVGREGKRVTLLLLAFRNDPYMFHQGNLREFWYAPKNKVTALLKEWVDSVISEYLLYLNLPLHGHNHQLLSQKFVNREQRDACGFTGAVTVNTGNKEIVSIEGSSTGICDIALTGVTPATPQTKLSTETYGPDVTTWVNMRSDSFQFNLATPISLLQ